jgi:hypothetical protein
MGRYAVPLPDDPPEAEADPVGAQVIKGHDRNRFQSQGFSQGGAEELVQHQPLSMQSDQVRANHDAAQMVPRFAPYAAKAPPLHAAEEQMNASAGASHL